MDIRVFKVLAEVMEPTIEAGQMIVVDPECTKLVSGKVFLVLRKDGALMVRRAFRSGDRWLLVPDNCRYCVTQLDADIKVIGKVTKKFSDVELWDL